tara:strand:- start:4596 stop:5033 length:438 start_codon:yes stop_codon:yes gene_type:complete
LDEIARKIIQHLQRDGRAKNSDIARRLGVSEGTVRRRIKSLLADDVLRVSAIPNLEKLGYGTLAIIGIQVDPERVNEVADQVSTFSEARTVSVTTGAFDIFVWVAVKSTESLGNFIREKMGSVSGIRRTETFVSLDIKKGTGTID